MATTAQEPDLWPDKLNLTEEETPLSILKAQAEALSDRTRHAVSGWVETIVRGHVRYQHEFSILAPVLGTQAKVPILQLSHPLLDLLPVRCDLLFQNPETFQAQTMQELKEWLRTQLASERTMKIVANLYAQARS